MYTDNDLDIIVAKNISYFLLKYGKTQKELADFVGVPEKNVYNWIIGVKLPTTDEIDKICMFFDVAHSDLFQPQGLPYDISEYKQNNESLSRNDICRQVSLFDTENADAITKAISEDANYYETRALELGIPVEAVMKIDQMEREALMRQQKETRAREEEKTQNAENNQTINSDSILRTPVPLRWWYLFIVGLFLVSVIFGIKKDIGLSILFIIIVVAMLYYTYSMIKETENIKKILLKNAAPYALVFFILFSLSWVSFSGESLITKAKSTPASKYTQAYTFTLKPETPKPKKAQGVHIDASRSSCFSDVIYYRESNVVEVCFRNSGKWYRYSEVPEDIIDEFISASSLGRYYNQNIKGQYPCEKMS